MLVAVIAAFRYFACRIHRGRQMVSQLALLLHMVGTAGHADVNISFCSAQNMWPNHRRQGVGQKYNKLVAMASFNDW